MRRCAALTVAFGIALASPVASSASTPAVTTTSPFDTLTDAAKAAMQVDPRASLEKSTQAERYARAHRSGRDEAILVATAQWLQGEALLRLNDVDQAARQIEIALAVVHKIAPGTKLEGDLLLSRGGIHSAKASVALALADYQTAHDIFRAIDDARSRAKALLLISALYGGGNDYENALRYSQQALDIYNADPGLLVSIYNNRGNAFIALGQPLKANAQFDKALALAREMRGQIMVALVLSNIATARLAGKDLTGADRAIAAGLRLADTDEAREIRPRLLAVAAQSALQHGDVSRAESLITQSFAGVNLRQTTMLDRDAHETAYKTYSAVGRADLALPHLVALKRIDDRATRLAASTNTALMGARFDFANQELRIAKLQRDDAQKSVAYERSRARTQRLIFLGTGGATIAIIAMLLFGMVTLRRSRDRVRAANADLNRTNAALGKALAAKTEFLATTSHEIRTPLNGILGMTQVMLADTRLDQGVRDRVSVVHGAGVTMRALVDDILDVAKMETGNLTVETTEIDLCATLGEATRMWEAQAAAKGLSFALSIGDCPALVMGDAARLRQIVFNLLSNAVKFTATGEVTLTATRAGDRYRVVVADTGIGIADDKHEEIFESFRQADAGTTRQFGGTGLGLTICRNLSRAMGGDVTVESRLGEGARFTLDLPLIEVERAMPVAEDRAATMLLVDRNPISRAMLKALFDRHAGMPILAVASIEEARARIMDTRIVRVLIDDAAFAGVEDLAGLRGATDGAIAVLSGADEQTRAAYAAAGADPVIAKPIAKDALVAAVFGVEKTENMDISSLVSQAA